MPTPQAVAVATFVAHSGVDRIAGGNRRHGGERVLQNTGHGLGFRFVTVVNGGLCRGRKLTGVVARRSPWR